MTDRLTDDPGQGDSDSPEQRAQVDQLRLFLAHWRGSLVAISLGTFTAAVAWGELIALPLRIVWCLLALANYLTQALVCWQLERAPTLAQALPRRMPWLQGTVAGSGMVWGLVPWMVGSTPSGSTAALLFAGMFNMLLIFAVVNSPSNRAMVYCAVVPVALLTSTALLRAPGLAYAAAGCAALCGLVLLYGLRVQTAMQQTMVERHKARDLADTLRRQQQRLIELEGERTLLLERQRLMRDLHDGLGSVLTSSLLAVEQGETSAPALAGMLRDCMDDLRTVIDSLEPVEHDVVALLASLRFRMGPRLERMGIHLAWDIQDLPPLPWLGAPEALQVLRMVQEMLTNGARHARARQLSLCTRCMADGVEIQVRDDGCGFDTRAAHSGRGLRFMAQRASLLGAGLQLQSAPGQGTVVVLRLPLQRLAGRPTPAG